MKIKKTAVGLQIKHIPGCLWICGAFFAVVGSMFLYGMLGGFSNYSEIETWEIIIGLIIALASISAGVWMIVSHSTTVTTINGLDKIVTLHEKGLFSGKNREFKFSEVSTFEIVEEKDSDNDSFYYIVLKTKQSEKIKINSSGIQVENYVLEIKDEINRYLEKEKLSDK